MGCGPWSGLEREAVYGMPEPEELSERWYGWKLMGIVGSR